MAQIDYEIFNFIKRIFGESFKDATARIYIVAVAAAVLFGVISWCVLKKFRTFRNYVLLSVLVAYLTLSLVGLSNRFIPLEELGSKSVVYVIMVCHYVLLQSMFQYWLLVLCFVFSVDFVKVFHYDVRKKYLWSNLFAWGLPILTVYLYALVGSILYTKPGGQWTDMFYATTAMSLLLIPVGFSFITYIAVICRLIFGTSKNNLCSRFTIATVIFFISNEILIVIMCPIILKEECLAAVIIEEILRCLLIIALIVFIVVLKSNWKLWRDYFRDRRQGLLY